MALRLIQMKYRRALLHSVSLRLVATIVAGLAIGSSVSCVAGSALATDRSAYTIGAGDKLEVVVADDEKITAVYTVRQDGTIFLGYLKAVALGDLTTDQANERITNLLKAGFIHDPQVQVRVKEYASRKIQVLGAVRKPGTYALKGTTLLLDAIGMAGGVLTEKAGGPVLVIRGQPIAVPENATVDVTTEPDQPAADPPPPPSAVTEADAEQPQKKTVAGINAETTGTAETAVAKTPVAAPTPLAAAPVIERITANYFSMVNEGKLEQNVLIRPGDVINVTHREQNEIYVLGNVNRPGPIQFQRNITLLQAITVAGGPSPTASTRSTYIIRKNNDGTTRKLSVRLDKIMTKKAENIVLKAEDVIVIPESFF